MDTIQQSIPLASGVLPMLAYVILTMAAYSLGGWLWETAYCSLVERRFVHRGVLYGPVCPLYGFAMLFVYYPLLPLSDPLWVFVASVVIATTIEYGTALLLESAFHRSFWSYDDLPLNIRGRVCLPASLTFGLFSLLVRYVFQPALEPLLDAVPSDRLCDIGIVVAVAFLVDFALSSRRWDLDSSRMPAKVAVTVHDVPDYVDADAEVRDIVSDIETRFQDDVVLSDLDGYRNGDHLRHRRSHMRLPSVRIVSAKMIADGKLFVVARIGEAKSMLSVARDSAKSVARGAGKANSGAAIVGKAVRTEDEEDCE